MARLDVAQGLLDNLKLDRSEEAIAQLVYVIFCSSILSSFSAGFQFISIQFIFLYPSPRGISGQIDELVLT